MIVLDCTLRDGGYHNNWNFSIDVANSYLKAMERSKIDAVEIGFRSIKNNIGDATFLKVTDEVIEDLLFIPNIKYFGVMINAKEMNNSLVRQLFRYSDKSPINLVRVATHFKDIDLAESTCKELKNFGYIVSCNLMQAADKSFDEIRRASRKIKCWNSIDILYLADSLGGMNHDDINYSYKAIKSEWFGLTGFHGHNNKSQALNNSLEAVDIGVDWVDATILGMGRGPGNTEIEFLLGELNKRGFGEFDLDTIYRLSLGEFFTLKEKFKWGPSLLYYLAAEHNIHPIYIQKLISNLYNNTEILNIIYYLKNKDSNSFDNKLLEGAINECGNNNSSKIF